MVIEVQQEQQIQTIINNNQGVLRVQSCSSPYFYAFYQHHPCKLLIDTGATLSLVSKAFIKLAGISIKSTNHFARQVDHSSLKVEGEIHIELHFGDMILPIDALVNILVGVPFRKDNDVEVHLKKNEIGIRGTRIPYGAKISANHTIYAAESFLLRNHPANVLFPGEFLELHSDSLSGYNGEISIEPRFDSPNNGEWPEPTVSRVIQGTIRIPNS